MDIDRECSVCKELASYFCRMCSAHYCAEHLCLHLSVAWESNTWTNRNKGEWDESTDVRENERSDSPTVYSQEKAVRDLLPHTPKLVGTYTETQLQASYQFYLSQARRVRTELERRAVLIEGALPRESKSVISFSRGNGSRSRRKTFPASASKHIQVLQDNIRTGTISLEQVTARIRAASATK